MLEPFPDDWSRAIAVVAHPDDLEYGAASAIARWVSEGRDIRYVLVTSGEAGISGRHPDEVGPLREEEERRSAAVVGVDVVDFLGFPDGRVEADLALRRSLALAIRRHRPDVAISINRRESWGGPSWNHPDHRATGLALLDAARDAANPWAFPDLDGPGIPEPWDGLKVVAFGASPEASHYVDVTDHIDAGVASLREHHLYLEALGDSAPDPDGFLRGNAERVGKEAGCELAVSFEVVFVG